MKKLFTLLTMLILGISGMWATVIYYQPSSRAGATTLSTSKKYMIYNTAINTSNPYYPRRWFLYAKTNTAYGVTQNTTPLTFNTANANYVWTLESGSDPGTYKIKNVGNSKYCAGLTALGATGVDYIIREFSTCSAKGTMGSACDDGTLKASANITSEDKTVYIKANTGEKPYWNGSETSFNTTERAHVYVLYEVEEVEKVIVTYKLYESDGTTFVDDVEVHQDKNSEVNIPSSLMKASDYTYETTGTIGTTDCTITIVRTLKANGYTPSLPGGAYLSVGDAATSMTAAISASDNDHWYLIMQDRGGKMTPLYDDDTYGNIYRASADHTTDKMNDTPLTGNEKYLVRFIETGSGTGLYYMQFANGNYIAPASASRIDDVKLVSVQTINSAGTFAFYVYPDASTTFGWNIDSKESTSMTVDNNGVGGTVNLWGTGTSPTGSKLWTLYPVTLYIPSYFVQYKISDDSGVIYISDDFPASNGDVITELPNTVKRAFCNYTVTETTVSNPGTTTVPVTMTWSGPFNISASFETAEWKLLQMRQGGYNVKYVAGASSYPIEAKGKMRTEDDAYLWAFIGNPYDGFEIVNKAAGSTMTLYAGASPANGTYPLMSTDNTTKWLVNGNPKDDEEGGFGLQVPDKSLYINDHSGAHKLSFWSDNTSADAGSTLTIADQYPLLVENNISPYFNGIGKYFSLSASAENLSTYNEKWTNAKTTCDKSTYDDLKGYVSDVSHLRYPATGNYRIKNVSSGNYVGYGNAGYSGKGVGLIEVSENDPSSILHLTKVSDGVYTISTQGLNVQKQSTRNFPVRLSLDAGANHTFTPLLGQVVSIRADQNDDKGYWYRSSWGSAPESIITWSEESDAAKWRLESASSISISLTAANDNTGSAHTYATLCVPFNVTALTGADDKEVKAYAPTKDGDYIVPGTGATTITEGTPVLLIGEEGATSVTAILGSSYATTPATSNVLTGTFTGTSIDCTKQTGTNYVLGFDRDNENRIGFYHVNSSSYSLKPNRAYLHLDTSGDARGFNIMFDVDDATGIVTPIGETEEGTVIYNLSGQRLNKVQKGINIVNGKKVLF